MKDIKEYLEQLHKDNWEHLRKNKPSFLDRMEGTEITTDFLLDDMLAKLDKCLEIQENSIEILDSIIEIINE